MSIKREITNRLVGLVRTEIKKDIVDQLMDQFEAEIVPLEDAADPMRPSLCRDEFRRSLEDSIDNSLTVAETQIRFDVGDDAVLGFGEELSDETTDCLKIIGTIFQGISGEYVLVTSAMAKQMFPEDRNTGDLGRTGRAYLMGREEYDRGVERRGWREAPSWGFSNFSGLPDFFENIELDIPKYIRMLGAE